MSIKNKANVNNLVEHLKFYATFLKILVKVYYLLRIVEFGRAWPIDKLQRWLTARLDCDRCALIELTGYSRLCGKWKIRDVR